MHRYRIVISKKDFSILKIGDDTLWRNYFLQLLLRSIILDNSVNPNNIRYRQFSNNLILLGQLVLQKIDHILQFRTLDRCNSMIHLLPV